MEHVQAKSWDDFHRFVADLRQKVHESHKGGLYFSPLLFRGHSNSGWSLQTTLERATKSPVSLEDYFRILEMVKPRVEAFTKRTWKFDYTAAVAWTKELPRDEIPGYEFLVYLRHHGFPSPFLDWTASPQIASLFAFRDTEPEVETVSVYVFCEYGGGGKARSSDIPAIYSYGRDTSGTARHFLQQSLYTVCTVFKGDHKQYFASHEDADKHRDKAQQRAAGLGEDVRKNNWGQDLFWKIDIPATERGRVLRALAEYNLNAFSLFATEESLAETLGLEYFGPVTKIGPDS